MAEQLNRPYRLAVLCDSIEAGGGAVPQPSGPRPAARRARHDHWTRPAGGRCRRPRPAEHWDAGAADEVLGGPSRAASPASRDRACKSHVADWLSGARAGRADSARSGHTRRSPADARADLEGTRVATADHAAERGSGVGRRPVVAPGRALCRPSARVGADHPQRDTTARRFHLGTLGQRVRIRVPRALEPQKGADVLIRALALVPAVTAEIMGSGGQLDALQAATSRLALFDRVRFTPGSPDTASFWERIDVLVVPSRSEALPLVILEALQAGRRSSRPTSEASARSWTRTWLSSLRRRTSRPSP